MKLQLYLINRTYIAEDRSTGLIAYAATEQEAVQKLEAQVTEYWQTRKVVVPINQDTKGKRKTVSTE